MQEIFVIHSDLVEAMKAFAIYEGNNCNTEELTVKLEMAYFALSGGTSLNHSRSMLSWSLTSRFKNSCKIFQELLNML